LKSCNYTSKSRIAFSVVTIGKAEELMSISVDQKNRADGQDFNGDLLCPCRSLHSSSTMNQGLGNVVTMVLGNTFGSEAQISSWFAMNKAVTILLEHEAGPKEVGGTFRMNFKT
jgi:hypothetical protein